VKILQAMSEGMATARPAMVRLAERIEAVSWAFACLETPKRRTRCRALGFWSGNPFAGAEGMRTGSVLWVLGVYDAVRSLSG